MMRWFRQLEVERQRRMNLMLACKCYTPAAISCVHLVMILEVGVLSSHLETSCVNLSEQV